MVNPSQPLYLNEKGKRKNNQDSIFPVPGKATAKDRLFMVCDGVGGSQRGDLASLLVCKYFPEYFALNPTESPNPQYLGNALKYTEQKLIEFIAQNKDTSQMATTLTLLHISDKGCVVGWCGDSRVYHLSKTGKIKYKTKDHSLVNAMVQGGEITQEEAQNHQQKHVILKAINPAKGPSSLDSHFIPASQIEDGDYFFLCSDGIWEPVDPLLEDMIGKSPSNQAINDKIKHVCQEQSHDNFSSYLIQIKQKKTPVSFAKTKTGKTILISSSALLVLIICLVVALGYGGGIDPGADNKQSTQRDNKEPVLADNANDNSDSQEISVPQEVKVHHNNQNDNTVSSETEESPIEVKDTKQNLDMTKEIKDWEKNAEERKNKLKQDSISRAKEAEEKQKKIDAANEKEAEERAIRNQEEQKKKEEAEKNKKNKDEYLKKAGESESKGHWATALKYYEEALNEEPDSEKKLTILGKIKKCTEQVNRQSAPDSLIIVNVECTKTLDWENTLIVYYTFKNKTDRPITIKFKAFGGHKKSCDTGEPSSDMIVDITNDISETFDPFEERKIPVKLKLKMQHSEECILYVPESVKNFEKNKPEITFASQ